MSAPLQTATPESELECRFDEIAALARRTGTTGTAFATQLIAAAASHAGACAFGLFHFAGGGLKCESAGPGAHAYEHLHALREGVRFDRLCERGRPELVTLFDRVVRSAIVVPFGDAGAKRVVALVFEGTIDPNVPPSHRRWIESFASLLPACFADGAPDAHELVLCYQPICRTASGRAAGAEALLRCIDERRGVLGPQAVLDAQTGADARAQIDAYVVDTCIAAWHELRRQSVDLSLHLNVGRADESTLHVLRHKRQLANDIPLVVEIGEAAARANAGTLPTFVTGCRTFGFGVGVAVKDDIPFLKHVVSDMRVDFVKLSAPRDRSGPALKGVSDLIALAEKRRISVIAEQIGTSDDLTWASLQGIEYVQGYAVAPPMTRHDLVHWSHAQGEL
jgi:EAL domain-containing protein (putative c-di-GMP-specific phosphodiesterase class I)